MSGARSADTTRSAFGYNQCTADIERVAQELSTLQAAASAIREALNARPAATATAELPESVDGAVLTHDGADWGYDSSRSRYGVRTVDDTFELVAGATLGTRARLFASQSETLCGLETRTEEDDMNMRFSSAGELVLGGGTAVDLPGSSLALPGFHVIEVVDFILYDPTSPSLRRASRRAVVWSAPFS